MAKSKRDQIPEVPEIRKCPIHGEGHRGLACPVFIRNLCELRHWWATAVATSVSDGYTLEDYDRPTWENVAEDFFGVTKRTLMRWLAGNRTPKAEHWNRLQAFMHFIELRIWPWQSVDGELRAVYELSTDAILAFEGPGGDDDDEEE